MSCCTKPDWGSFEGKLEWTVAEIAVPVITIVRDAFLSVLRGCREVRAKRRTRDANDVGSRGVGPVGIGARMI